MQKYYEHTIWWKWQTLSECFKKMELLSWGRKIMELFPREKNKVCPELERYLIVGVLNILVQTYIDRFSDILIILSTKTRQDKTWAR